MTLRRRPIFSVKNWSVVEHSGIEPLTQSGRVADARQSALQRGITEKIETLDVKVLFDCEGVRCHVAAQHDLAQTTNFFGEKLVGGGA